MSALVIVEPGQDPQNLVALAQPVTDAVEVVVLAVAGLEAGEATAEVVAGLVSSRGADLVLLPATPRFAEVAALLTGRLDAACAPDAIALAMTPDGLTADRLLYGGVVVGTVALQRPVRVVTAVVKPLEGAAAAPEAVTPPAVAGKTLTGRTETAAEGGLANAERVVAFGRALRSQDDIALVQALADALGAAVGCSRPIVDDNKWLDLSYQVGLTGTTVRPQLYLALGISGQIQHLVGMRDSTLIVAVNTNPSAPIFEASDLSVVGDLYQIVPRLTAALAAR
ncbi:MAG: electron transfer flavoprotein subunit alpha/FixB family protein [Micrococcales bacterium]|nr:electron transfer flavoprotein subunit alpha/FixB family protein [Micrococcales bacterium]